MSEFDTGYSVFIGKPVVHAEKKATGSSVSFPCEAIPDGSYLVSLEVNGSVKAYRESLDFSSGSCTVGEYTLSYSSYALTVSGTSNNNIVRVMVEPLEVKTTDAFRAAVKKDAPVTPDELPAVAAADKNKYLHTNESTGALEWAEGGSGGGVLVVTETVSGQDSTLSATYKQIADAGFCVLDEEVNGGFNSLSPLSRYGYVEGLGYVVAFLVDDKSKAYIAETENAYPVYHDDK